MPGGRLSGTEGKERTDILTHEVSSGDVLLLSPFSLVTGLPDRVRSSPDANSKSFGLKWFYFCFHHASMSGQETSVPCQEPG